MGLKQGYIPTMRNVMDAGMAWRLYSRGADDKGIAEACSVHTETVRKWRNKHGLKANRPTDKVDGMSRLAQVVAEARAKGMTYGQYMAVRGR